MAISKLLAFSLLMSLGISEAVSASTSACVSYYTRHPVKLLVSNEERQINFNRDYMADIISRSENGPGRDKLIELKLRADKEKDLAGIKKITTSFLGVLHNEDPSSLKESLDLSLIFIKQNPEFEIPFYLYNGMIHLTTSRLNELASKLNFERDSVPDWKVEAYSTLLKLRFERAPIYQEKLISELETILSAAKSIGITKARREMNKVIDELLPTLQNHSFSPVQRIANFSEKLFEFKKVISHEVAIAIAKAIGSSLVNGSFLDVKTMNNVESTMYSVRSATFNPSERHIYDEAIKVDIDSLKFIDFQYAANVFLRLVDNPPKIQPGRSAVVGPQIPANPEKAEVGIAIRSEREIRELREQEARRKELEAQNLRDQEARQALDARDIPARDRESKESHASQFAQQREAMRATREKSLAEAKERSDRLANEKRAAVMKLVQDKDSRVADHVRDVISTRLVELEIENSNIKTSLSFGNLEDNGAYVAQGREAIQKLKQTGKKILIDADTVLGRTLLHEKPDPYLVFITAHDIKDVSADHKLLRLQNDYLRMGLFKSTQLLATPSSSLALGVYTEGGNVRFLVHDKKFDLGFDPWLSHLYSSATNLGVKNYFGTKNSTSVDSLVEMGVLGSSLFGKKAVSELISMNGFIETAALHTLQRLMDFANEFEKGIQALRNVPAGAVVFGSASNEPRYRQLIWESVYELGRRGVSVATGGSGGYMELANAAAFRAGAQSVGIPLDGKMKLSSEMETKGSVQTLTVPAANYEQRIPFLLDNRQMVVVAPGGSGTMKELATAFIALGKEDRKNDVLVFLSKNYYGPLFQKLKDGDLPQSYKDRIFLVDSKEEMVDLVTVLAARPENQGRLHIDATIKSRHPEPTKETKPLDSKPAESKPPEVKGLKRFFVL